MMIRRIIPHDELKHRLCKDLVPTEPAGHPKDTDYKAISKEHARYISRIANQRAIIKHNRYRYKGGALD